jgi:hypothetical protein
MSEPIQRYRGGLLIRPSLPTDAVQGEFVTYADALAWVQREVEKARAEGCLHASAQSNDTPAHASYRQAGYEQGQRDERHRIKDGVVGLFPGLVPSHSWDRAKAVVLAVIDAGQDSKFTSERGRRKE